MSNSNGSTGYIGALFFSLLLPLSFLSSRTIVDDRPILKSVDFPRSVVAAPDRASHSYSSAFPLGDGEPGSAAFQSSPSTRDDAYVRARSSRRERKPRSQRASRGSRGHGMARGVEGHDDDDDDTKNCPFLALQRDDVDNRRRAANAVASTHNRFKMAAAATAATAQPDARVRDT